VPSTVADRLHKKLHIPYFVTPRGSDLSRDEVLYQTRARVALLNANQIIAFDEETHLRLRSRFDLPASPEKTQVLRRGIDLNAWYPLPRHERFAVAGDRLARPEVAAPLDSVQWDRSFVMLAVEPRGDRHGFEQFLFATPEILRLQPQLQIIVVGNGEQRRLTDGLRAAMTAGRPELLHDIVKTSELCQPLVDHLERLHQEGRADAWWKSAARIEPERRVRFLGPLSRLEFTTLLPMSDLLVIPGSKVRPPSQMFYESLACGVLPMASELAGIRPIAERIGERISHEIAALCVLRTGVQPVREMEEKLGRVVRLRPDLRQRLRSLAEEEFDGHQVAVNLRRIYNKRSQPTATTAF
jgi:glycosyltransferase involved in cell wall biosynthesis